MAETESEKFVTPRHPTLGDAAGRHVPELAPGAAQATPPHVTPLMENAVIARSTSWMLIFGFLLMTVCPAIWALLPQLQHKSALLNMLRHPTRQNADAVSTALLDKSSVNQFFKRTWGQAYSEASGDPLGKVIVAHDGFLFYRDDYDLCAGKGLFADHMPAVVSSLVQYSRDLQQRGIHFLAMPIPAKSAILPQKLWPRYPMANGPALNSDYKAWIDLLRSQGVDVVDLTDDFWQMSVSGKMPYLAQDTHWTPAAMQLAAERLADRVQPWLGDYSKQRYTTVTKAYRSQGDLVELMGEWGDTRRWPPEQLQTTGVLQNGKPPVAGDDAAVLLLGDSYTLAYADPETNDVPAGLPQHLMLDLQTPVQYIAGHAAGHFPGGREVLAQHPEMLQHKKVVIWEFTSRVLPSAMVPLPTAPEPLARQTLP